MRFTKIFPLTLLILSGMLLPSCLKDQEEIFDTPSSLRMQEYLDNAKATLTSSPQGWIFDYFPDRELSYGGYVYTVKFDEANVTVGCELAPGKFETSLYKLTDDNGPILSFDSYNSLMHYFSTPSSGQYQAFDGDFEFRIMDVTDDLITLKGNRTGNTMYLRRLDSDPAQYLNGIKTNAEKQIFSSVSGTIGSTAVIANIDIDVNYMDFTVNETTSGDYFLHTPTGIRFMQPIEVNGATISELNFTFDGANNVGTYSGTDSNGNQVNLSGSLSPSYTFISDFSGAFTFSYGNSTVDVNLVPDEASGTVTIEGISPGFNLITTYNKSQGSLDLSSQTVYASNSFLILFAAGTSSSFYPATGAAGVVFVKDPNNPSTFVASPNKQPNSAACANNFIIVLFDGTSYYLSQAPWLINNSYTVSNVKALIKK